MDVNTEKINKENVFQVITLSVWADGKWVNARLVDRLN